LEVDFRERAADQNDKLSEILGAIVASRRASKVWAPSISVGCQLSAEEQRKVADVSRPGDSRHAKVPRAIGRRIAALLLLISLSLASASPAFADRYDKHRAGHPLRIAAYVLYPIGALIDVLIMRPAHWLVSQEPFKGAVGHRD
jgi:hypothetical protein